MRVWIPPSKARLMTINSGTVKQRTLIEVAKPSGIVVPWKHEFRGSFLLVPYVWDTFTFTPLQTHFLEHRPLQFLLLLHLICIHLLFLFHHPVLGVFFTKIWLLYFPLLYCSQIKRVFLLSPRLILPRSFKLPKKIAAVSTGRWGQQMHTES
jgi:hypothetical protein